MWYSREYRCKVCHSVKDSLITSIPCRECTIFFGMRASTRYIRMTLERMIARLFLMDDRTWMRHANPWSVMLRLTVLPLLVLALWSRLWLGWLAVIPVCLAVIWAWLNPRIVPPPRSLDNWTSKGVLGERVWLNRDVIPVPSHHRMVPHLLSVVSGAGMLLALFGAVTFEVWPTLVGIIVVFLGKVWFVDRMVWLWHDMQEASPEYRRWKNGKQG